MNTAAAKPKLALGYMAADLPAEITSVTGRATIPVSMDFYNGKATYLKDRAEIEEDPSFQHFIPYIVLINERNEVFIYSRGKDGGEKKLVGNLSIGLGGHVDEQPAEGQSLLELLQLEGARELKEEAGLELPYAMQFRKLLIDRTNKVGLVHLGLLAICPVDSRTVLQLDDAHFLPFARTGDGRHASDHDQARNTLYRPRDRGARMDGHERQVQG
jgi:predicted NUDIX family phosphoesterase